MNVESFSALLHHHVALIREKCQTGKTENFAVDMNFEASDHVDERIALSLLVGHYFECCTIVDKYIKKPSKINIDKDTLAQLKTNPLIDSTDCEWPVVMDTIDQLYWKLHQHQMVPSGGDYDKDVFRSILDRLNTETNLNTWIPAIYYASMNREMVKLTVADPPLKTYDLTETTLDSLVTNNLHKYKGNLKGLTCCGRLDETLGVQTLLRMRIAALLVLSRMDESSNL